MMTDSNDSIAGKRTPLVFARDAIFGILGTMTAIVIWVMAGGVFHRTLELFTRLNDTAVNIISSIGGFVIMTACTIIVSYVFFRIRKHKSNSAVQDSATA